MLSIKNLLLYILILLLIYPGSPVIFKRFLSIKEPAFICPVISKDGLKVRSDMGGEGYFGARRSNGYRRHEGLDLEGQIGDKIVASKSGFAKTGNIHRGMGRFVKIYHMDGCVSIYGHLNSISAKDGMWIWQGQKIGELGKTGNASAPHITPHLHFEIRIKGVSRNPLPLIEE